MRLASDAAMMAAPAWAGLAIGDWFVLQTKSRQEKILSRDLQQQRVAHFLPLTKVIRYYGGRRFEVELPVFPGYVFLKGCLDDAYAADRTRRISHIIRVHDQIRLEQELLELNVAVNGGAVLCPYPYLKVGTRVVVRSGPFRGLQGVIENHGRASLLILQVDMLGQAVSMEIEGSLLEPVD
jgi:transcription antitermination factor NusG